MAYTEKLIEIVRNYSILYDMSHEEYKNIRSKDKIWDKIGKKLKENGEQVKKRWKNLRDTYAKYIRITKTKTGEAAKKIKKWQWADHMEAFRPLLMFAKTSSNVSDLPLENVDNDVTSHDAESLVENSDIDGESVCQDLRQNITEQLEEPVTKSNNVQDINTTPSCTTAINYGRRKRRAIQETKPSSVDSVINYLENKQKNKLDAIDLLFLAHASTLKTFSGKRQAITKMKIAQVIMEEEIAHVEEQLSFPDHDTSLSRPMTAHSYYSSFSEPYTTLSESNIGPPYAKSNLNLFPIQPTNVEITGSNYLTVVNPYPNQQ